MNKLFSVLRRIGRASVGIILAGLPAYFANDPKYLLLAPIINGAGKWLRSQFGLKNVPF